MKLYNAILILLCSFILTTNGMMGPIKQTRDIGTQTEETIGENEFNSLIRSLRGLEGIQKQKGTDELNNFLTKNKALNGQEITRLINLLIPGEIYTEYDNNNNFISQWKVLEKKSKSEIDISDPRNKFKVIKTEAVLEEIVPNYRFYQIKAKQYKYQANAYGSFPTADSYKYDFTFEVIPVILWRKTFYGLGASALGAAALYYGFYPSSENVREYACKSANVLKEQFEEISTATQEAAKSIRPPRGFTK